MKNKEIKRILVLVLCIALILPCAFSLVLPSYALEDNQTDIIASSASDDWFSVYPNQGTWTPASNKVSVDAFGCAYSMEGATYLSPKGSAYGAFEYSVNIKLNELNNVENPIVGIIPWYVDENNYIYIALKYSWATDFLLTDDEKAQGHGLEQVIVSGKYNGEGKYTTVSQQQENTTINVVGNSTLQGVKKSPLDPSGHNLTVRFENSGSTATFYNISVFYEDVKIATSYAYYYNAVASTAAAGFIAQDVKADFSSAIVTDFFATNNTAALARDWKNSNGYTYRVLNGTDVWTFNADNSISFDTAEVESAAGKTLSAYKTSGTNYAGYDTNRGFTINPVASTAEGLPQNYEVKADFTVSEITPYTKNREYKFAYGLLAWYKNDQNFIDVTICRTESGIVGASTVEYEVVLCGWIDGSNAEIGTVTYKLPEDFDATKSHTLRVEKKSIGFFVYLDQGSEPIISKRIAGTDENYFYGYTGYNVKFSATQIQSRAIYTAYDEVSVKDDIEQVWKISGNSQDAWQFQEGKISLSAKETTATKGSRSYILGMSDISDKDLTLSINANIALGASSQMSELMFAPYMADDNNYVRIGLAWKSDGLYARVRSSVYTDEDYDEGREPSLLLKETKIANIDLASAVDIKVVKVGDIVALYVGETLVYGVKIANIGFSTKDYGIYAYNMDLTINTLATIGYKKYEKVQVGDWITSGMKYNEWTVDENGYLHGDATYNDEMIREDTDDDKNFAIKENTLRDNYVVSADIKAIEQTQAEDRVGIVVWYVDKDNYLIFYLDMWRSDSTVPRTTLSGLINGEYLPTRYNHGGWLPEGDKVLDSGYTQTELSQVTQLHTITVTKTGNTFTCSVDAANGLLTYTVEAGLPEVSADTKIYSGIYALNDSVVVSAYSVTAVGTGATKDTPFAPNNPISAQKEQPVLGTYTQVDYSDEFDGITTSGVIVCPEGEHDYVSGICDVCGKTCPHSHYTDGVCDECEMVCPHTSYTEGVCDTCGQACTHTHYTNGVCDACGQSCAHANYANGICDTCGQACTHSYEEGICTVCGEKDPDFKKGCGSSVSAFLAIPFTLLLSAVAIVLKKKEKENTK